MHAGKSQMRDFGLWLEQVIAPLLFAPLRGAARQSESLANVLARRFSWSPLGCRVLVTFDDSDDNDLIDVSVDGAVRACSSGANGSTPDLLIELNTSVAYNGRFSSTPCGGS